MITLAIDASTKSTGIAIFNQGKLIHHECINSYQNNPLDRIIFMTLTILEVCKKYSPTDIVMQDVLPEQVGNNQNVYTLLMYLQASLVLAFHQISYDVILYPASHWRRICGIKMGPGIKRNQLKKASQDLVLKIYNLQVNDDISDAICLGMAYIIQNKH